MNFFSKTLVSEFDRASFSKVLVINKTSNCVCYFFTKFIVIHICGTINSHMFDVDNTFSSCYTTFHGILKDLLANREKMFHSPFLSQLCEKALEDSGVAQWERTRLIT